MMTPQSTRVAILGGGKGGSALLDLLDQLPGVEVIGIADKDPQAPGLIRAAARNIPVIQSLPDLVANHGAHLIVDVTGDPAVARLIETQKPPGVEVLGGASAKLLWTLVQHEAQLQAGLFQAEKLAGIGSFAAGIAHDINNPLYLVLGFAENILEDGDLASIREHAQGIIEAVKRISPICKDLTQYARRSTTHDLAEVELNGKLDESLKIARYATVFQDLSVVKDYAPSALIKAEPEDILHAFVNLITNAIQAMDGSGTLRLATRCEDGTAHATIADSGCGIPPDRMEKVFEPFFTTKAPGKGTGLGLYNVRAIVRKYQGQITVESEVGKGTTFHLQFPQESQ